MNTAHSARSSLARGLSALQAPGVPTALLAAAEPIANAMAQLHEIEASGGHATQHAAPRALAEVRRALSLLQADASGHPSVGHAMESVAGSLGLVHSLTAALPAPVAPVAFPPAAVQAPPVERPAAEKTTRKGAGTPLRVTAELGVHSPSNFYRGLSGNDVVDAGGLFVATYQVPKIGRPVLLHVVLPGGFEFDAAGVVRWTRDASISSTSPGDAPPGFGAAFTEIPDEARRLVQRYVQNREPLFHDDL